MKTFFTAPATFTSTSAPSSKMTADNADPAGMATLVDAILSQGHTYNTEQRRDATKNLMACLRAHLRSTSSLGSLESAQYLNAVTALKTLGRSQDGTEDLASEEGINLLLELAQYSSSPSSSSNDNTFLQDPLSPTSSEAIRCLANVCLLHEPGRVRLASVDGLPEALMKSGEQATNATTQFLAARLLFLITVSGGPSTIKLVEELSIAKYLTSRLLENLEEFANVPISAGFSIVNPSDAKMKMKVDVLIEYLKVAFDVTLFYPRAVHDKKTEAKLKSNGHGRIAQEVGGENGQSSTKQKGKGKAETSVNMSKSLSASSTSSNASSASSSSKTRSRSSSPTELFSRCNSRKESSGNTATNMSPSTSSMGNSASTSNGRSKSPSNLPKMATDKIKGYFSSSSSTSSSPSRKAEKRQDEPIKTKIEVPDDTDILKPWGFDDVVSALVQLALCLPYGTGPDYGPFGVHKHVINALINFNFTTYSNTVYAPLSPFLACPIPALPTTSPTRPEPSLPPLVARLLTLLDGCLAYYIPGRSGPDDEDAREASLSAPGVLDESLQVLVLLLTKCAIEDVTGDTKRGIKLCLLADDIDRSVGLEKRDDLTGRLVRLLGSTYLSGSSEATGKFLFSICDQDPSALVAAIGYGNASGFLQSMNMLIPPGAAPAESAAGNDSTSRSNKQGSSSSTSSRPINPITGAYEPASSSNEPVMTDEEKEREAEKLFVLFDRMNRNGAMSVVNPVKQAQENGQLSTTTEEEELERKKMEDEDEEDERQALAELQAYKDRKNRTK